MSRTRNKSSIFSPGLPQGIKNLDVEIYDECTFATDPQIASGNFPIPENVVSKQGRKSPDQIAWER